MYDPLAFNDIFEQYVFVKTEMDKDVEVWLF